LYKEKTSYKPNSIKSISTNGYSMCVLFDTNEAKTSKFKAKPKLGEDSKPKLIVKESSPNVLEKRAPKEDND